MPTSKPANLKDAIVEQAFAIIEEKGVEQLSFREVARRLGVSHQAPYKHFPSKDHILAAVVARCFETFAAHLEAHQAPREGPEDLHKMGAAYLGFATAHPLMYRLMFNTPLPSGDDHKEMLANAQYAFSLLREKMGKLPLIDPGDGIGNADTHDALFVWFTLHGMSSLMHSTALETLDLSAEDKATAIQRTMQRLRLALEG